MLCSESENPAVTYRELSTTIDTAGAYDLLDIAQVKSSWLHAARLNTMG